MRVLFLLNEHPLHNRVITDYLAARPADEVGLVKVPLVLKGKSRTSTAQRILPQLSRRFLAGKLLESLAHLSLAFLPRWRGGPRFPRLRRIASMHGLPFHVTGNVMSKRSLAFVRGLRPNIIVSCSHQILKRRMIEIPTHGVVNVHPGLLPEFRGIQPYFWALSEGARRSGATLHLIEDEGIDTGRVLARTSFDVPTGASVQLTYALTAQAASRLLPGCLEALIAGRLEPRPQDPEEGTYRRWPDSAAYDRLAARGHSLFSWRQLCDLGRGRFEVMRSQEELEWVRELTSDANATCGSEI